jgi:hypothetical protein
MLSKQFEEYIIYRTLTHKYDDSGHLMDRLLEREELNGVEVKNVCAKITIPLVNRLENVVDFLGVSKREFIEFAILEAVQHSERIIKERMHPEDKEPQS